MRRSTALDEYVNRNRSFALELLLAAAVVVPASVTTARSGGRLLLRLEQGGGDLVLYYTTYELRESRVLSHSRSRQDHRVLHARLTADEYRRCLDLLLEGGYFGSDGSERPTDRPRTPWRQYAFATTWGLSLFRAGHPVDAELIPEHSLTRYVPELTEDRRLQAGWALLSLFEEKVRKFDR
jgi:hypothetical protein